MTRYLRATVAVIVFALVGCTSSPSIAPSGTAAPSQAAASAGAGGSAGPIAPTGHVIVVTDVLTGAGQDPIQSLVTTYKTYWDEVFDYAIEQDANGKLVGGFASSWEASADHLTWTFVIRDGLKFHNGDPMTAADVAWSWNREIFDPASKHNLSSQAPNLDSITASGNKVLIKTKLPISTLPIWFAKTDGSLAGVVYPKSYFEKVGAEAFFKSPVGTGPFKFVKQDGEQSVDLTAFTDPGRSDWQKSRTAGFKDMTILAVQEPSTRLALLKTGGADLVQLPISALSQLKDAGLKDITVPASSFNVIWCVGFTLNPASPCNDIRVREALSIAIDRQTISQSLYNGLAEPSAAWMSGPGSFGYPSDLAPPTYNPDRAKQLLEEAGFTSSNPLKLELQAYDNDADFPSMTTLAEALVGYYEAIGVTATVKIQDWDTQKGHLRAGELNGMPGNPVSPVVLFMRGTDNRYYFPAEQATQYAADGKTGQILWNNTTPPGSEQLARLDAVKGEFDLMKQEALFADYHKWMASQWYHIPLMGAVAVFGVSNKVASWDARVAGKSYPHNLWSLVPAQ
jgi:peptide/nickel transport system substrate-binding protein